MTCANWMLTVGAALIIVLSFWPEFVGASASKWVIVVTAVVMLVITWTIVECKPCMAMKKKGKKK